MPNLQELGDSAAGDSADARSLFNFAFGKSHIASGILTTRVDSERYNMSHENRGQCIIFNNRLFDCHTNLQERRGTDVDAEKLKSQFSELGFEVTPYHNKSVKEIIRVIEDVARRDFSKDDCFVCCVLSHGDEGILYGRDGKYDKELLFAPFKGDVCPSLAGKPKIFFIQACQGDRLDEGVCMIKGLDVDSPDAGGAVKVPVHADFLIAYSTVPGHYSWRNTTNGSWFIQGVCCILEREAAVNDLLSMLTNVNRFVAYGFESSVPTDRNMDQKKQVPYITHTLTRKVFFPRNPFPLN